MLFPYQEDGAEFLSDRRAAMIADPPGLGKTAQAITGVDKVDAKRVLVICPASLKTNWSREFAKFSTGWSTHIVANGKYRLPDMSVGKHVVIVNYDILFAPAIFMQMTFVEQDWDVMIVDEAHYLKTRGTRRTNAVYGEACDRERSVAARANRIWLLTGTPTPNGDPSEIWTHLRATGYTDLGFHKFMFRYGVYAQTKYGHRFIKTQNVDELKASLANFMLRRKKEDVLKDMPPIVLADLVVEAEHAKDLRDLESHPEIEMLRAMTGGDVPDAVLAEASQKELATLRRYAGILKVRPVANVVKDELRNGDGKIVLFAWHKEVLALLRAELAEFNPVSITGETPSTKRQDAVDTFQGDTNCRVFLGQITAAGTGITLTAASRMIIVEPSFVPADNEQASLRIHRIGQRDGCLVQFAALADSVDEVVTEVLRRKTQALIDIYE